MFGQVDLLDRADAEIYSVFREIEPGTIYLGGYCLESVTMAEVRPGGRYGDVDYGKVHPRGLVSDNLDGDVVQDYRGPFNDQEHPLAHEESDPAEKEARHRAIMHNLLTAAHIAGCRKRIDVKRRICAAMGVTERQAGNLLSKPEKWEREQVAALMRLLNVNLCDLRAERRVSRLERIQATLEDLRDPWLRSAERIIGDLWLAQLDADQADGE